MPANINFYPDTWDLVDRAAGIACIKLQCHKDTWETFVDGVAAVETFSELHAISCGGESSAMVEVELSGVNLMSILRMTTSDQLVASFDGNSPNAVSIAIRLRKEIVEILGRIARVSTLPEKRELPTVILYDSIR